MVWIFGSGGHAKSVARIASLLNVTISGFIGPGEDKSDDDVSLSNQREKVGFLGVGIPESSISIRTSIIEKLSADKWTFPILVDPTAVVRSSSIGDGTLIQASSYIGENVRLGPHTVVSVGAIVEHDTLTRLNVFIGPNATICGGVHIDDHAIIGAGAVVLPGVTIGKGVRVAAGSVISRNVGDDLTSFGELR